MEYRDYYATLGVPRTASSADIKKAFRKLARTHHPDVNAADAKAEARFKEVNEAHDVLSDPKKRKLYDQLGADWERYRDAGAAGAHGFPGGAGRGAGGPFGAAGAHGFPGGVRFEYQGDPADLAGFSDFFRAFFAGGAPGQAGAAHRPARGARAHAGRRGGHATGDAQTIEDLLGTEPPPDGRRAARPGLEGELEVSLEDVATGTTAMVVVGDRRLEVKVPAGVDTGQRIRLSGKAGTGPDAGDVTLLVRVRIHPVFTRSGADVTRDLPITLAEALLGAEVPVGTPAGRTLLLTIPAGTQTGRSFRLRGHGLPRFKVEGTGDLIVRTRLVLPGPLDEEGRRLAEQLTDHVAQADPRTGRPADTTPHRPHPDAEPATQRTTLP